ncbi:MAG: Mpo1-like protein [Verrucomicrobiota bacterium]
MILGVLVFSVRPSASLALGMRLCLLACDGVLHELVLRAPWPGCLVLFVLAWIGQFIAHKISGRKPSFSRDGVFLLIGPAWLLHFLGRKIGLRY